MSFPIDAAALSRVVDFDQRDDPSLVKSLEAEHGGVSGLLRTLSTSAEGGAPASSVPQRVSHFGRNFIEPPPAKTLLKLILEQFEDRTLQILLVGGTVSLILGAIFHADEQGWIEGLAIYLAIVIVVTVTAVNDFAKEKKFRKAQEAQQDREVKAVRDGAMVTVSTYDVCVGDVLHLAVGDEVPADGVYVSGLRLSVDEAALTGESKVVKKSEERPFLFAGSVVSEGDGVMLVTTVGSLSAGGRIQELLNQSEAKQTPLQGQLDDLAVKIGWFGMAMGVLTFVALTITWAVDVSDEKWDNERLTDLVDYFVIGVTIVVVAVPEGLPLAVTIALAFSMLKMIKDRNFVRHLDASETMGEATCICSDKTGTLTQNRMTVTRSFILRKNVVGKAQQRASSAKAAAAAVGLSEEVVHHLAAGMCVNSKAYLTPATEPGGLDVVVGNKTEGALINLALDLGVDYVQARKEMDLREQFPFTSSRKRMSTVVASMWRGGERGPRGEKYVQYVKGASEIVLALCDFEANPDGGKPVPLSRNKVREYEAAIDEFARQGLRTLTVAYRWCDSVPSPDDGDDAESRFALLGILGIKDPVRDTVPGAVLQCQKAGITVRMVTGDNIATANYIAQECGILTDAAVSIEGPQFRAMTDDQRRTIIPRLRVLARSSPEDKQVLVKALMDMGEVVAVTGDGTNDAPALKEADVGFAMGIAGTDIAKNASDIILLDDNFASIVNAIKWGRNVFDAIRKFLQFQLSVNVVALVVVFIGSIAEGESPMSTVQLLWVNLVMDTLGALALATGDPDPGVLDRMPHKKDEGLMTRSMIGYVAYQFVVQTVLLLLVLFSLYKEVGIESDDSVRIHTLVFCTFVLMQITNMISTRQLHNELNIFYRFFDNWLFCVLLVAITVVQVIVVQFGKDFTKTVGLDAEQWLFASGLALIPLVGVVFYRIAVKAFCAAALEDDSSRNPHQQNMVSDAELEQALSAAPGTVVRSKMDSNSALNRSGSLNDNHAGMQQSPSYISIGKTGSIHEMYGDSESGGGRRRQGGGKKKGGKGSSASKKRRSSSSGGKKKKKRSSRRQSSSSSTPSSSSSYYYSYYYSISSSASSPSSSSRRRGSGRRR